MKVEIPEWFDTELIPLLEAKVDRSKINIHERRLDWVVRQIMKGLPTALTGVVTKKFSWKDIEEIIEENCAQIDYKSDVIMGIKSGGAFIANYVAKCLNVSVVDYMHISHYSAKSRSVVKSAITSTLKDAVIKEEPKIEVKGKKVLLVDDQTATGTTLEAGVEYLKNKDVADVKTFCLHAARPNPDFYATFKDGVKQLHKKKMIDWDIKNFSLRYEAPKVDFCIREGMMVYTPWGKDA